MTLTEKDVARFWAKVHKKQGDDCWPWLGGRCADGYGTFHVGPKTLGAHRIAYALGVGAIGDGLCVCHRCDHPSCVNPAHLFLGTHARNMADRNTKGRARGASHNGAAHGMARLGDKDVVDIRRIYNTGLFTQTFLATLFGVSVPHLHGIVRRKTWIHI